MDILMMIIAVTSVIVALPGAILETREVMKLIERKPRVKSQKSLSGSYTVSTTMEGKNTTAHGGVFRYVQ